MKLQNFEKKNEKIRLAFEKLKAEHPEKLKQRLNISFSTWVFGLESLEDSVARLRKYDVDYIELGGNYGGKDVGYQADIKNVREILSRYDMKVSGICGFFSDENALSTPSNFARQTAKEYIKAGAEFCREIGGTYLLVVPGPVGRSSCYDTSDFTRSAATLREVADVFVETGVKCAVEPINSAEVPFCSSVKSVIEYIQAVDHTGVQHINGDIFHMHCEESHVGEAILACGDRLINLHVEDTTRQALGTGMMDMDTVIRALYLLGYNRPGCFVTGEPLGPGRDSYKIMFGQHDKKVLDSMVEQTVNVIRERENELLNKNPPA